MSKLVDERVVELRFDNSNFERNTRQSMSTIQKLKSSLNFSGVANSINKSVNSIDMSPITYGLEKASKSFSAWEVVAISVISNIANRVTDLGIKLVESLTTDNIKSGWEKFSQQTKTVGTIIAQLSNTMDKAEATALTNEYMKKVQWFADATSYSLTDMTDAINKFIGKGREMDESFNASVGIANWAATAGKNAQEAKIAFNALSKVADHVLSRQWTSIELGTMDTIEFKNAALEAAAQIGTLTKSAERFDGTIEYITDKGNTVTATDFSSHFADEWFNTEVLMKVLGNYGNAVNDVMELNSQMSEEAGKEVTPYEALDAYIEKMTDLAKAYEEAGDSAKKAEADMALFSANALKQASEARTLEDAVNAVKDAVSTGWLNVFTKLLGEYATATEFFSELSDKLLEIFFQPIAAINKAFEDENNAGFREYLFGLEEVDEFTGKNTLGALWNLFKALNKVIDTIKAAWKETFPMHKSLLQITKDIQELSTKLIMSEDTANNVKNIFKGLFSILKLGIKIFKGIKIAVQPIIDAIVGDRGGILKFLGDISLKFSEWVNRTEIFTKVGTKLANGITSIINRLKELKIVDRTINSFKKFMEEIRMNEAIQAGWKTLKQTFSNLFDILLKGIRGFLTLSANYLIPAMVNIIKYAILLAGVLAGALVKGIHILVDAVKKLVDYIRTNETIQNGWKNFVEYLKTVPDRLKKLGPFFTKLGKAMFNFFKALWDGILKVGAGLANMLKLNKLGDLFVVIGEKISYGCSKIVEGIKSITSPSMDSATEAAQQKLGPLATFFKGLIDLFKGLWNVIKALLPFLGRLMSAIGALLTSIANSFEKTFNKDISSGEGIDLTKIIKGGIVLFLLKGLYDFVYLFKSITAAISDMIYAIGFDIRAKAVREWAEAIKTVAMSVLILVGAIYLVTLIDENKLQSSLNVILSLMGVMAAIVVAMGKFMKSSSAFSMGLGKGGLSLKSSNTNSMYGVAKMVLSYGLAILALTAALKIIDSIDEDKIFKDLAILAAIMVAFSVAVGIMNAIANIGNKSGSGRRGITGLLGFALAMLVILIPIKKMGEMPLNQLKQGLQGIAAIMLAFGVTVRIMNGLKAKGISKMAVFATAMAAIVMPVQMLGSLDKNVLFRGVAAVSTIGLVYGAISLMASKMKMSTGIALIGIMTIFGYLMNAIVELIAGPISKLSQSAITKFAIISGAVLVFLSAIMIGLANISKKHKVNKKAKKNLIKTLAIFVGILAAVTLTLYALLGVSKLMRTVQWEDVGQLFTLLGGVFIAAAITMQYSKSLLKTSSKLSTALKRLMLIGIIVGGIVATMAALAGISRIMKDVEWVTIWQSLTLLGAVLLSTLAILELSRRIKVTKQMIQNILMVGSVIAAMGLMMTGLAALVSTIKTADTDTIKNVLLLLSGTLLASLMTVFIAAKFSTQINKVSKSLLQLGSAFALFGAAAVLFAVGLQLLSGQIQGLIIFAGIVVVLGVAMKVLGAAIPSMLTIAVAFGVMGAAALAIGAAFYLIIQALNDLLPTLDQLAEKSDKLTVVISALVQGIVEGIAKALPIITENLLTAVDMIIDNIHARLLKVLEWFKALDIKDVWDVVVKLNEILFAVLFACLDQLKKNIRKIVTELIDIANQAIYGLIDRLPEIMQAIVDFVLGFIDALGQTIENNAARIRETMVNFCKHLWNAFLNFFGIHSPSKKTSDAGQNIILGIIQGIGKQLTNIVRVLVDVGKKMLRTITELPKQFLRLGAEIFTALLNGIKSVVNSIINFVSNIISKIKKLLGIGESKNDYRDAGREMMVSYRDGMESGQMDANKAAKDIISETVKELSKTDIFETIGENIVTYIAYGISDNAYLLATSIREALTEITQEMQEEYYSLEDNSILSGYINKLLDIIENGITDEDLTIRPVMDLTEIQNGTGLIAAMLASVSGTTIATASVSAEKASNEITAAKEASETNALETSNSQVTNTGDNGVYNLTFNITGNDPKAIADEVSKRFQQEVSRRNLKWA